MLHSTTVPPTPDAITATAPARLSDGERAEVAAALRYIRAARCTTDDDSISMTWEIRDDVISDLSQAIELLKKLVK